MNNPVYTVILATDVHNDIKGKSEGKRESEVHPVTGHEGPAEEMKFRSTLSSTSAPVAVGWWTSRLGRFNLMKDPVPIV